MNKFARFVSVMVTLIILLANSVFTQPKPNIEVTKIKENFYRLTSNVPYAVNFLAYVTKEGILLVDSGPEETGNLIKKTLKTIAIGNPDVKILINTHAHLDHTGGNISLAGEPLIIGQEILRKNLRNYSYLLSEFPDNALPSVTFKDSSVIYFGDEKIRIIAVPGSHDITDVIVHFTKAGILCVGDIYEGLTVPTKDVYTGNLLNFPKVIDKIISLVPGNVTIFSGHDKEVKMDQFKQSRDIIVATTNIVKEEMSKGKDIATMQKENILNDWAKYANDIGGNMNDWIEQLANAPRKYIGSLAGELYKVLVKSDVDEAIKFYYELKRDHPTEYPFFVDMVGRPGFWLLAKGRTNEAVKIFELCVKEFPNSAYAYGGLGEAYMKAGNKELALKNYEKSLRLNPENKKAEEILKRLRESK